MSLKNMKRFCISALALGIMSTSYASGTGFYIGVEGGKSYFHNKKQTLATTTGTTTLNPSNTGVGGGAYLGYNLNDYFGLEAGYTHYAPTLYTIPSGATLAVGNPSGHPSISANGVHFVGKGMWPIGTTGLGLFGKAGVAIIRSTKSGTFTTGSGGGTTNYFRPTAGVGVSYNLTQNWEADVSVRRVFGGGGLQSLDLVAAGISYHFVDKYCGQFLC
jgi:opacity protein-like surface antigen